MSAPRTAQNTKELQKLAAKKLDKELQETIITVTSANNSHVYGRNSKTHDQPIASLWRFPTNFTSSGIRKRIYKENWVSAFLQLQLSLHTALSCAFMRLNSHDTLYMHHTSKLVMSTCLVNRQPHVVHHTNKLVTNACFTIKYTWRIRHASHE